MDKWMVCPPPPHNKVNELTSSMTLENGSLQSTNKKHDVLKLFYILHNILLSDIQFLSLFTVPCLKDKEHWTNNRIQKLKGDQT